MAIKLTDASGDWVWVNDPAIVVCVELGAGVYKDKRMDEVEAGDKVCLFPFPSPGPSVLVDSTEVV